MKKKKKSIIIIGAGLSGLSAGCYAQMNGFESTIFEMHSLPGGNCTSWYRGDYMFDWTIMWMLGTGHGNEMNQIWMELGALQGKKIKDFDIFNNVRGPGDEYMSFYVDPDALEAHLKQLSPADSVLIENFCRDLKKFMKCVDAYPFLKPVGIMNIFEKIKMSLAFLPFMGTIKRSMDMKMSDYAGKFTHPFLKKAFNYIFFDKHPTFPLLPFYFNMACAAKRNAGVPEGGSIGVAKSIEKRYTELGGKIIYRSRVNKIIVQNNKASGVILEDGTSSYADIIISAGDGRTAVYDMLEGKYVDKTIDTIFLDLIKKPHMIYPGWVSVFLGLHMDLSKEPHSVTYLLTGEEAGELPGVCQENILVQIRSIHYPESAPEGRSVLLACYFSDYDYWKRLYQDKPLYKKEKKRTADFVIRYVDKIYPGLKEKVEKVDVSTPCTIERYTGGHKGSVMGWDPFNEANEKIEKIASRYGMKLPGLKNFYMTGQWIDTGGVIRVAANGRHVIQFVCKDNKQKFKAYTGNSQSCN